ncbi:MAG: phospholipase A [Candidatus Accumulibacter sp.]|uniref:Phospholipase A1 n=1 Tax=Candidatus Accumulibacter affinis TaxID=2954384 RepID=A0A935T8R5_9PROT|nr:phospholipase A [Candidatus Accumulibacter affinis]
MATPASSTGPSRRSSTSPGKSENPDIQKYRGYGDFRFTYGKNDDWQLALSLRKGTQSNAYSSDLQATYPLNRLLPGLSGYLMGQYFTGYGKPCSTTTSASRGAYVSATPYRADRTRAGSRQNRRDAGHHGGLR